MTDRRRYLGGKKFIFKSPSENFSKKYLFHCLTGAAVKMDHFQPAIDPRKQELLEARFLGARVSNLKLVLKNTRNF